MITILFVDDDEALLRAFAQYFGRLGHRVLTAPDGRAGMQTFIDGEPDVTVIDLKLPDISGLDVLAEVRRRKGMAIMLTGMGEVSAAVEAMKLGAENFLTKPIEMSHLAAAIEKAAEKGQLKKENVALRAQLSPNLRRTLIRVGVVLLLALASAALGLTIGEGRREDPRERAPIPVPIEGDTVN